MTQPLNRVRQNEKNRQKNRPCKRALSDLELSGELSDEEDIYNSLPRGYMSEPEDTQEEIERMRAEREQQQVTTHTESVPDIKRTDDCFWCSCEKCELMEK